MRVGPLQFKEIEHKYVVNDAFDLARFREVLASLGYASEAIEALRAKHVI